jgi:FtsP/CotA-like multicopper oxidase with cupredoxin domain
MNNKAIIIAVITFLVGGVFWYTSDNEMSMSRHMDMMTGQTESDLTKLPDYAVEAVKPTEVVELQDGDTFDLTASIVKQEVGNRTVKRLAYNGQIPGPVLKVQRGAKVTVNFTNNIDMETALHSHGLRGDWKMDGAVPITPAIEVGESFSYELEFPDTGVYWYHPHVREDYQQELGLYGNFIVEEEGYWNEVDQEEYLIFDDILEDGDFSSEVVTNTLMGRFGDTILINDKDDFNLTVTQGEISRIFVTNVANTRTFDLAFDGAQMKLVGGDNGRIEQEVLIDDFIIAPSERYIVELLYSESGTYPITHRGETVGEVTVEASVTDKSVAFSSLRSNATDYTELRTQMDTLLAQTPDKRLRLDIEMKGMMGGMMMDEMRGSDDEETVNLMGMEMTNEMAVEHCQMMPQMAGCEPYLNDATEEVEHSEDGIEWEDDMAMMNQMSNDENIEWVIEDQDTGDKNGDIDWSFKQGDMVKVRVYNDEKGMHPMQHPIHFHGQRFVVLATDGVANENLQWKDTVLIPKGQTYDLLIEMSNVGQWMAHCHIAEHLHSGMMFQFEVE